MINKSFKKEQLRAFMCLPNFTSENKNIENKNNGSRMIKTTPLLLTSIAMAFLFSTGCSMQKPDLSDYTTSEISTASGALVGAGLGAIIGSQTGDAIPGTLIGGLVGAGTGKVVGDMIENKEDTANRQQMEIDRQQAMIKKQQMELNQLRNSATDSGFGSQMGGAQAQMPVDSSYGSGAVQERTLDEPQVSHHTTTSSNYNVTGYGNHPVQNVEQSVRAGAGVGKYSDGQGVYMDSGAAGTFSGDISQNSYSQGVQPSPGARYQVPSYQAPNYRAQLNSRVLVDPSTLNQPRFDSGSNIGVAGQVGQSVGQNMLNQNTAVTARIPDASSGHEIYDHTTGQFVAADSAVGQVVERAQGYGSSVVNGGVVNSGIGEHGLTNGVANSVANIEPYVQSPVQSAVQPQIAPQIAGGVVQGGVVQEGAISFEQAAVVSPTTITPSSVVSQEVVRAAPVEKQQVAAITNQAVMDAPTSAECHKASREARKGESSTATADKLFYLRRALRLCPTESSFHVKLGKVYSSLGRSDDAKFEFQEALRISPGSSEATTALSTLGG